MDGQFAAFLRKRAERNFRSLLSELDGVSANDAGQFRLANWPDHKWGVGQDGSIAGIVYHVAAWKQMTLPVFEPGGRPLDRSEFDASMAPAPDNWTAVELWLRNIGETWNARLHALADDEFDVTREWEGVMLPITSFVVEMMEHDIQHASQIAYLKQRLLAGHN